MIFQRFLYSLLLTVAMPIIVLRLLWRSRKNPAYRYHILSRFGYYSHQEKQTFAPIKIWIHAVSVGETLAAKPLISELIKHYGNHAVLISSTTPTGFDTVRRLFADKVQQQYFPNDLPWIVNRALSTIQPKLFIAIETEIWPNFWHACYIRKIPIFLVNARLSTRSTARYKKVATLASNTLQKASLIACRTSTDAQYFLQLGAREGAVKVIGDIKWDIQNTQTLQQLGTQFRQQWGENRLVLVAASTHEGEDEPILDLFIQLQQDFDNLLLVIVPRHPERFETVKEQIIQKNLSLQCRSDQQPFLASTQVVLGNSMGEMQAWFAAADLVIMGGSLINVGGHNPMEAAAYGVAVISGPTVHNFTEAFDILTKNNVAFVEENIEALQQQAQRLLANEQHRQQISKVALEIVAQNKGATNRIMERIKSNLL